MATISVDTLGPTDGPSPRNLYDPESLFGFIEWSAGDQALITFRAPDDYDSAGKFQVTFDEIVPASPVDYLWLATVAVFRRGPDTGEVPAPASIETGFDSHDINEAGQISTRTIEVAPEDIPVGPGDNVSIRLEYSSAGSEPCPEKLLTLAYRIVTPDIAPVALTPEIPGRIAQIAREARDLFNEETGDFLSDEFVARAISSCIRELARENCWPAETWLPVVAGEDALDVFQVIPDAQEIHRVWFMDDASPMIRIETLDEFIEMSRRLPKTGVPQYYLVRNNRMKILPAPCVNSDRGYYVDYASIPPTPSPETAGDDYPPSPRAFDSVFTLFVLKQAFLRDRNAPGADLKFREYSHLYETDKKRLLEISQPSSSRLRASR